MTRRPHVPPAPPRRDFEATGPSRLLGWFLLATLSASTAVAGGASPEGVATFNDQVVPFLEDYCYGCHGLGLNKGGVSLDAFDSELGAIEDRDLWARVLEQVRAGLMPPEGLKPSDAEVDEVADWIKFSALGIDPDYPDPGRVTVRRLNRVEYRNTVRDLIGVDFDTGAEFPPDDTGHGFDNIGEALSISPLLLEKYLAAAEEIIGRAVPTAPGTFDERTIPGRRFQSAGDEDADGRGRGPRVLSYYEPSTVEATVRVDHDGPYEILVDLTANDRYVDGQFDYNACRLRFLIDGEAVLDEEYARQEGRGYRYEIGRDWSEGEHSLAFELEPLTPDRERVRSLSLTINAVTLRGPIDEAHLVRPPNYERFFPRAVPERLEERRDYARELIGAFATRAYRRPVDERTLGKLVDLAEGVWAGGDPFEAGVARGMVATLASPGFLFREEGVEPGSEGAYPLIDEYALASRLSYFLWSTMPDEELIGLARRGALRDHLRDQVDRMLTDDRSDEFVRHFVGQWLQARDIESVPVNAFAVLSRDQPPDPDAERHRERFRELRRKPREDLTDAEREELDEAREAFSASFRRFRDFELDGDLRRAMRRESEMLFAHIVRDDRSLLELIDGDYTFLNERLARHYGVEGVEGDEMRRVELPEGSPRGGVLTQGTVLAVTSNPDRTSPVKRGLFILDNILGTPPAPPPPNIPSLEEAGKAIHGRDPTLRETLALHRSEPLCSSCHNRMDPLGLAFENFNALGIWRDLERQNPIDSAGTLITGESFDDIAALKRILADERRLDFYRCLSEKLMTYALGRGIEPADAHTIDGLVARLDESGGLASSLMMGIVESAPFQRRRRPAEEARTAGRTGDLRP